MITFQTQSPAALLKKFDNAIAKGSGAGSITTWRKVDGYYTHTSQQWAAKAYFKATAYNGGLRFNIVKNKSENVSVTVYGYYHGHLTETFLNHFDSDFALVSASPKCTAGDLCAAA
jgi:hypothetical protein